MELSIIGFGVALALLLAGAAAGAPLIVGLFAAIPFGATAFATIGGSSPLIYTLFALLILASAAMRASVLRDLGIVLARMPLAWLLIRRWTRPRPPPQVAESGRPTLGDQLRPLVEAAVVGRLTSAEKARLERLLIAHWRRQLDLNGCPATEALRQMRGHSQAGELLRELDKWLHRPPGTAQVDVAGILEPYRAAAPIDEEKMNAEVGMRNAEVEESDHQTVPFPHSAFRLPHFQLPETFTCELSCPEKIATKRQIHVPLSIRFSRGSLASQSR